MISISKLTHKKFYLITAAMYLFIGSFAVTALREKKVENDASRQAAIVASQQAAQEAGTPHAKKAAVKAIAAPSPSADAKKTDSAPNTTAAGSVSASPETVVVTPDPSVDPADTTTPSATTPISVTPPVVADPVVVTPVNPIVVPKPSLPVIPPVCGGCGLNLQKSNGLLCPMAEQSVSGMICAVTL